MKYEGNVPHMYLDTKGYVTVGVGHLLNDVEAAKKFLSPFGIRVLLQQRSKLKMNLN